MLRIPTLPTSAVLHGQQQDQLCFTDLRDCVLSAGQSCEQVAQVRDRTKTCTRPAHLEGMKRVTPTMRASTMQAQAKREVTRLRRLEAKSDRLLLRLRAPDGHLAGSSSELRQARACELSLRCYMQRSALQAARTCAAPGRARRCRSSVCASG